MLITTNALMNQVEIANLRLILSDFFNTDLNTVLDSDLTTFYTDGEVLSISDKDKQRVLDFVNCFGLDGRESNYEASELYNDDMNFKHHDKTTNQRCYTEGEIQELLDLYDLHYEL